jgi:histidinol phosphatase-like PHP family hydrolase
MQKSRLAKCVLSVALAGTMLLPFGVSASAVQDITGAKSYKITNPYETVNWNTWNHYKANLHTHSAVSDGLNSMPRVVEEYYKQGYDILAMTDHGSVNRGWNVLPQPVPILGYPSIINWPRKMTQARYEEVTTGSDRGGRGMTDVPYGIELNAGVIRKNHVNGFFCDYGQNMWGKENDFETPIAGVEKAGGLSHINHPGDWLGSSGDVNIAKDPKNIKFFADLLKKYHSCLGIEVLNEHDSATRNDRVLWDGLLESCIPAGRNVWGFSNSDSHLLQDINTEFEYFMMPSNTVANVRTAMENGTFFACGRFARPELGDSFVGVGDVPSVTNIIVNDAADQITIQGTGYDKIEWIAKGEVIATGNNIDLNAYESQIGHYVRAQLIGPGGICFTQAFALDDGSPPPTEPTENIFVKMWDDFVFSLKSTRIYVLIVYLINEFN